MAASTAQETVYTAAIRRPAMMVGMARGSSTLMSVWKGDMPQPLAASTYLPSTPRMPV